MTAPNDRAAEELTAVRAELTRLDGKCSTLTGLAGIALAFILARITAHTPILTKVALILAGGSLQVAAVILLVLVLRPRLGSSGFNRYAHKTPKEVHNLLNTPTGTDHGPAEDLAILSRFALEKNKRLRLAIDFMAAAAVLATLGTAAGAFLT